MEVTGDAKIKHKQFVFKTSTLWSDGKSGVLSSEGKPSFNVASPAEFKSESGSWSPEDLFVASVEACHMATFMSFAAKKGLQIVSYRSHTNGVLEFVDGDYRFTRIVIFPTIVVSSSAIESEVHAILQETETHCLVTNSIDSIVEVNPTIIVQ